MTKIIDFKSAGDRADEAEIERDAEHWDNVVNKLTKALEASSLWGLPLVSATLRALLETLEGDCHRLSRHDAKALIASTLKIFHDPQI